jgi:hypothetical protein
VTVAAVLFAVGAVFTVLPGPGLPFLFGALAVLAAEFAWAERRLHRLRAGSAQLRARFDRRRPGSGRGTGQVERSGAPNREVPDDAELPDADSDVTELPATGTDSNQN